VTKGAAIEVPSIGQYTAPEATTRLSKIPPPAVAWS
jgi:hypothetical protein